MTRRALISLAALAAASPALAHDDPAGDPFNPAFCGGAHCAYAAPGQVERVAGGYNVILRDRSARFVSDDRVFLTLDPDAPCHVCQNDRSVGLTECNPDAGPCQPGQLGLGVPYPGASCARRSPEAASEIEAAVTLAIAAPRRSVGRPGSPFAPSLGPSLGPPIAPELIVSPPPAPGAPAAVPAPAPALLLVVAIAGLAFVARGRA